MRIGSCEFSLDGKDLKIENRVFSRTFYNVDDVSGKRVEGGLSLPYTELTLRYGSENLRCCLWDDIPVVYMPDFKGGRLTELDGQHWMMRSITLNAFTDDNDTLVTKSDYNMFEGSFFGEKRGEIFFFENPSDLSAVVVITENPDYCRASLRVDDGIITLDNGGYPVAVGYCKTGECETLCRDYYRHACAPGKLISMSNTWGDRNGSSRICEKFILDEIQMGAKLGVDIVQIDDGWQSGSTADLSLRDTRGRRIFNDDFWNINYDRFPNGIKFLADKAESLGMKLGLWFAPYTANGYEALERDLQVLGKAYEQWGVRFFKLDMYWIESKKDAERFLEFLSRIYEFGNDVSVQLDITRNARINYLCGRQYGNIFAENRYTGSANYFPHRVLRNMWSIGHYIPTRKFQFEMVNPTLNVDKYGTDVFAPQNYSMDYLFATVMLSNPLFWMEMQFLPEEKAEELKRIVPVWKKYRDILSQADVVPIGNTPDGRYLTGFYVDVRDSDKGYLLLFNEVCSDDFGFIDIPVCCDYVRILAANSDAKVETRDRRVYMCAEPRTYVFAEIGSLPKLKIENIVK